MKRFFRHLIVFSLMTAVCPGFSQKGTCFEKFFNQGKMAYDSLRMKDAISKFEAALLCPDAGEAQRDSIQQWKLKIDEQLRVFLKKRDAANVEKARAQVNAIDEKIDAAQAATSRREFAAAVGFYNEAIQMIDDLGRRIDIAPKRNFIEKQIQRNDSLLLVKRYFDHLIAEADSLVNAMDGNYVLAFEKLEEARGLQFHPSYIAGKLAALKARLTDCVVNPCFSSNNKPRGYFYLAALEHLTGNKEKAGAYVKTGLRQGKMKYYPQDTGIPEEIKSLADQYLRAFYNGKVEFYFGQQSVARMTSYISGPKIVSGASEKSFTERYYFISNENREEGDASERYEYADNIRVNCQSLSSRTGIFLGNKISGGLEIAMYGDDWFSFTRYNESYDASTQQHEYVDFGGTINTGIQLTALARYKFVAVRKRKFRYIPLIEFAPVLGLGWRQNSFEPDYSGSKIKKNAIAGTAALYVNFRIFRRFYLSLGYRGDMDLKPAVYTLSSVDHSVQTNIFGDPVSIIFSHKRVMTGLSLQLLFRMS